MSVIHHNYPLKAFNSFQFDASASCFLQLDSLADIQECLALIRSHSQCFVLGGGSNLLLLGDYPGLVIYPQLFGIELQREDENHVYVQVGASENWHQFVSLCVERGWHGLENLALIPGTVGASPVQNIGAYGVEVKEFISKVHCVNLQTGQNLIFNNEQCDFAYRDSLFKRAGQGAYLVTQVEFKLNKRFVADLSYRPLADYFADTDRVKVKASELFDAVCQIRRSKLPDPKIIPNAGSFFKNPVVSLSRFQTLQSRYPGLPNYEVPNGIKLAAAWLIDQAGFKGVREGRVGVHSEQALVLISLGESKGQALLALAKQIQCRVEALFGVRLEAEVCILGAAEND